MWYCLLLRRCLWNHRQCAYRCIKFQSCHFGCEGCFNLHVVFSIVYEQLCPEATLPAPIHPCLCSPKNCFTTKAHCSMRSQIYWRRRRPACCELCSSQWRFVSFCG
uniref:Uncharacterized protein n=1 Tax=Rhipicephalus microplus TaxID=6941 RepID=A0A6G5AF11_RHIMP